MKHHCAKGAGMGPLTDIGDSLKTAISIKITCYRNPSVLKGSGQYESKVLQVVGGYSGDMGGCDLG
jgi:hypothetical protein